MKSIGLSSSLGYLAASMALLTAFACSSPPSPAAVSEPPFAPDAGTDCKDDDGDGAFSCRYSSSPGPRDCDDSNPSVHEGAAESCDGVDNDCNGKVDENTSPACAVTCAPRDGKCESIGALAVGAHHGCVITSSSRVLCFGANDKGQLASADLDASKGLVEVVAARGATALSAADDSTCARKGDGNFVCWGGGVAAPYAMKGDVENEVFTNRGSELCVASASEIVCRSMQVENLRIALPQGIQIQSMQGYRDYLCILSTSGTVYCNTGKEAFKTILTGATKLAVGRAGLIACAIVDGESKCWDGSYPPVAQAGLSGASDIAVGPNSICALAADGRVGCSRGAPSSTLKAKFIAAGERHTCVVTIEGRVSCWGNTALGALGDGTVIPGMVDAPRRVGTEMVLKSKPHAARSPSAACRNSADFSGIVSSTPSATIKAIRECVDSCKSTLKPDECKAKCSNLSVPCRRCFESNLECTGEDCQEALDACAGFSVLEVRRNSIPRTECEQEACELRAPIGSSCSGAKDCRSGACAGGICAEQSGAGCLTACSGVSQICLVDPVWKSEFCAQRCNESSQCMYWGDTCKPTANYEDYFCRH